MSLSKHRLGRINLRISLLFSLLFIGTSLTLFGAVVFMADRSLQSAELEFIRHKLLGYWALSQTQGTEAFLEEIHSENILLEGTPFFLRLSDPENRTLFLIRPEGWKEFFPEQAEALPQNPEAVIILKTPVHSYSLVVGGIPLSSELFLQIGTSTEVRRNTLSLLLRTFALLSLPLLGISFLIGSFLTARTLSPIHRLTERVKALIDTGDLEERVPIPRGRNELQDLVTLFNRMLDRIHTLVHSMRETIDTLAHDMRTPMTRFRGAAELALRSAENPSRWKEALEEGIEESDKLLRMMNTILDIAEAEAGSLRLRFQETNAGEILQDLTELYSLLAEEKDVQIHLDLSSSPLWIHTDPDRLRQVVGNLLDNAVKYSPPGKTVLLKGVLQADSLLIRVEDEGEGIPPQDLPHIWNRLYRGEKTRSKPGLGLGLSLVKAIVEAHGGSVHASNNPVTGGAVFEVRLPV
ncbi:MAG: HAMP domain-containing protein [Spirochaetales bacterium]|nr:HAMP domain-containing protein [Spirochaetales bacterium]